MEHKGVYTSLLQLPKLVHLSALNNKILKYRVYTKEWRGFES